MSIPRVFTRPPLHHKITHATGGTDAITLGDLGAAAQSDIDAAKKHGQLGDYVAPATNNQDLNTYLTSGAYAINLTGLANGPGLNQGVLTVSSRGKDALVQVYVESNHDPARMAIRSLKASVWTPWRRVLTTDGADTLTPAAIGALAATGKAVSAGTADSATTADNAIKWNGHNLIVSSAAPSGGTDGDIWLQYL